MIKYNIKTLNKYRREALTIKNEGYKVCLLCGEEKKSFVRSHSIPMFSLKSIADIGKVKGRLPFLSTSDLIEDYVENKIQYYKYGIKEAGTFKNICQGCEEIYFTKIEHEKKFYQVPWTSEQLTRNALKSLLYENHILLFYKCFHEVVQNNEKSEKDKKC